MYKYTKDVHNKDLLINLENGYHVMMEWETQYMKDLIKKLNPTGKVLEIGFGLGISASEIQKYDIESHTIIECNETVLERLREWAPKQKHQVNIVEGRWQDVLKTLDKFDSIFWDDSPDLIEDELEIQLRGYNFFYEILESHVNVNCRYTWFLDDPIYFLVNPYVSYDLDIKEYDIPDNCGYTTGTEMYLPLITFKTGTKKIDRIMLDDNLNIYINP